MTKYRLESKPEWSTLVRFAQQAPQAVLVECLRIIRRRSLEVLSGLGWQGIADPAAYGTSGEGASKDLRADADAADARYLDALDEANGIADDRVLKEFAKARALGSLVWTTEAASVGAVLEGAYELSVVSDELNAEMRRELSGVVVSGRG